MIPIQPTVAGATSFERGDDPVLRTTKGLRRRPRTRERRRAITRSVQRAALGLGLLAGTVLTVVALRPRPVPVDRARAVRGPLELVVQESGKTRVKDRYVVSMPMTGLLSRVRLEPGDAVREGEPLAEVAPSLAPLLDARARAEAEARLGAALSAQGQALAQRAHAEAARALSAQRLARSRALAASGSIAAQALDEDAFADRMREEDVSSGVFAAKVTAEEVRSARATLGAADAPEGRDRHVTVVSPVAGRVLRVDQKSAGVQPAGTPLLEVGDPSALEVVVDLLTTDAVNVTPGTTAVIDGWGGASPVAGRVRLVEPSAFTRVSALGVDEQRVNVVIALVDPRERWAALGDGYRVEARIVLWRADAVLKVPLGAVFRRGDGWATYRIERGRARLVPVTLGHRGDSDVEVLAGVEEGAEVAVHPGERVKDGARVDVH